jgi:hypothetical protein
MDRPNRGWRQRAWRLGLALLVTAAVAGCGGAAATPSARSSAAPDHGRRLVQAGCNAAAAVAPPLPSVRTAVVHMDDTPASETRRSGGSSIRKPAGDRRASQRARPRIAEDRALSFENLTTVPKALLTERITRRSPAKLRGALNIAAGC